MSLDQPDPRFTVFISYSNRNDLICHAVQEALADAPGVRLAVDTRLLQGDEPDWHPRVLDAVYQSDLVIALLSKEARASPAVREELQVAREWMIPIVPVHAVRTAVAQEVPRFLWNATPIPFNLNDLTKKGGRGTTAELARLVRQRVEEVMGKNKYFLERRQIRAAARSMTLALAKLDEEKLSPALDFRHQGIRDVCRAAAEEAKRQADREVGHEENLSLENTFLIRALSSFGTANKIYAVSSDKVSRFWESRTQAENAQQYLRGQTGRVCRLFVLSDARSAHRLRHVLAAHHRQYGSRRTGGDRGGVFLCSDETYQTKLIPRFLAGETGREKRQHETDLNQSDFGILEYSDGTLSEYYKLVLTGPKFLRTYLGHRLDPYHSRVMKVFEELRSRTPGDITENDLVLRWKDAYATRDEEWAKALGWVFRAEADGSGAPNRTRSGRVFHIVFFHRDVDRDMLLPILHSQLDEIKGSDGETEEPLVEELCVSLNTAEMLGRDVTDGRYSGRLRIDRWFVEQYPIALITTHRSIAALVKHYEGTGHSKAREVILKALDPKRIGECYRKIHAAKTPAEREFYYECVEAYASSLMHRVDFQEFDDINMIITTHSHDHGWQKLWRSMDDPD